MYTHGQTDFMLEIERSVCGCDYGGTSWTTREEADRTIKRLKLEPGVQLLEIGSGSGWPGLYLAQRSGCDATLTDLPLKGLQIAQKRAEEDQLSGHCRVACADAAALPFRDGAFDVIYHSDVLCCLVEKQAVLKSCRNVQRQDGKMLFSVIFITPGLSAADQELAIAGGPPFVDAPTYPEMLRDAQWHILDEIDLTQDYLDAVRRHVLGLKTHKQEIVAAFGEEEAAEMLTRRVNTVGALEAGLLQRVLYTVTPAM